MLGVSGGCVVSGRFFDMSSGAIVLAMILLLAGSLLARDHEPSQSISNRSSFSFEVASIRPDKSDTARTQIQILPGGRFRASNVTLAMLIAKAYGVKESQIVEAPAWLNSERYAIQAKPDESVAAALNKLPPLQLRNAIMNMLQSLLADRFKLALDHQTKEAKGYALVVAKNGPKFGKSSYDPPENSTASGSEKGNRPRPGISMDKGGKLTMTDGDLTTFANMLSDLIGRMVVNKTGLPDRYDFTLQWTPEQEYSTGPSDSAVPAESSRPALPTAIQEQLGLKLEPQKVTVDVLVIRHVESPSAN